MHEHNREYTHNARKILILSGEPSGDNLGSKLINTLYRMHPHLSINFMGGEKMQKTKADLVLDSKTLAIVGVWEALTQWKKNTRGSGHH